MISNTDTYQTRAPSYWHVTVGQSSELLHTKRLLLDVVLSEEPWLASHHLLDGSINHQIIYVVIGTPRLPAFRGNHLSSRQKEWVTRSSFLVRMGHSDHHIIIRHQHKWPNQVWWAVYLLPMYACISLYASLCAFLSFSLFNSSLVLLFLLNQLTSMNENKVFTPKSYLMKYGITTPDGSNITVNEIFHEFI